MRSIGAASEPWHTGAATVPKCVRSFYLFIDKRANRILHRCSEKYVLSVQESLQETVKPSESFWTLGVLPNRVVTRLFSSCQE